jgi:hypothetical protein
MVCRNRPETLNCKTLVTDCKTFEIIVCLQSVKKALVDWGGFEPPTP